MWRCNVQLASAEGWFGYLHQLIRGLTRYRDTEKLYTFRPAHGFSARNSYTWQRRKSQKKEVLYQDIYINLTESQTQLSNFTSQAYIYTIALFEYDMMRS
jgi:hypothetical protein